MRKKKKWKIKKENIQINQINKENIYRNIENKKNESRIHYI